MPKVVMDASALLALLNEEPGADVVGEALLGAIISAVNLSEVVAKLCNAGMPEKAIRRVLQQAHSPLVQLLREFPSFNHRTAMLMRST